MLTAYKETGYDVIFMLDGTVNDRTFTWMTDLVKNMANEVSDQVNDGTYRLGGMTFTRSPDVGFQLDDYGFSDDYQNAVGRTMRNNPGGAPDMARAFDTVYNQMFQSRNGDRPQAKNYIVMVTANEKSLNSRRAINSARRLKNRNVAIYTVGINLGNTDEIDSVSSLPLDDFQVLLGSEIEMAELPGRLAYGIENGELNTYVCLNQNTSVDIMLVHMMRSYKLEVQ